MCGVLVYVVALLTCAFLFLFPACLPRPALPRCAAPAAAAVAAAAPAATAAADADAAAAAATQSPTGVSIWIQRLSQLAM